MIKKAQHIKDYKGLTATLPTKRYVDPEYIYIPLTNGRCKTYTLDVDVDDHVLLGQQIGVRDGGFFKQPIHSFVSGIVVGFEKKFHRSGKRVECIKIKNDFKDTYAETIYERSEEEIAKLTQDDMVEIVKKNSVVGLGGSGFPTYIKLATKDNIKYVVINAVECEPYLTSDYRLILDFPERIYRGISYIMQAVGAEKCIIAIKKNKSTLYDVLTRVKKRFPDLNVEVKKIGDYYPQGWELEVFKNALGIKVPQGVLPTKYGILGFNVSTVVGIYKAIRYNMPVVKRHFTVTGDGIKYPQNIRVRVGTPIKELIELCDGYTEGSDKILILGGPMMGQSLVNDDVVVSKTMTSVIVLDLVEPKEEPCVRCGSCVYTCPVGIQPVQIMNAVKTKDKQALIGLHGNTCIECGLCTYVCTSKIHLTDYCRRAKRMMK